MGVKVTVGVRVGVLVGVGVIVAVSVGVGVAVGIKQVLFRITLLTIPAEFDDGWLMAIVIAPE